MNSGVYIIINNESGKVYIGYTVDFGKRQRRHYTNLRGDYHPNKHLQSAWNKYGESAFEFMICEYVKDKEQLHIREQYWLDYHRMLTEVYNHGTCARNPMLGQRGTWTGRKHTKETKQKISGAAKGHERSAKTYPAFIHEETGRIIPAGFNLRAMCREEKLTHQNMCNVKNGRRPQHKGWTLLEVVHECSS